MTKSRIDRTGLVALCAAAAVAAAPAALRAQQFPPDFNVVELLGNAPNENFGKYVVGLGDVNGNGYDDIAVGAPFAAPGGLTGAGAVYIYFGGPGFPSAQPDLVLTGESQHDQFGVSIAGGMDLDGDGYADFAVGARFSDLGASNAGAVFVYRGGQSVSDQPWRVLVGEAADDWFGQSVAAAGDVNGDGYDDLIVGAPYNDQAANAAGKAYVFFGGPAMDTSPDVELLGADRANSHFGWSVSGAGDVNGDGHDDVIVGARLYGIGPTQGRGRAFIYFGGASVSTTPDVVLDGESAHDWFGQTVAGVGDVNGDGFDDVAVGAIYNDDGGSAAGKAYVFIGGEPMSTQHAFAAVGPEADAQLGFSLAGAGDINDDGYDDVIVGAHFADVPGAPNAGKAYVLLGGPAPTGQPDYVMHGLEADDQFGVSVAGAGVLTDDALPGVLIGSHFDNGAGPGSGKTYVAWLDDGADCPPDWNGDGVVDSDDLFDFLADWAAGNADYNGDGVTDSDDLFDFLADWSVGC